VAEKKKDFSLENGMLWCILIHYFTAPMCEAAWFEVCKTGYNPKNVCEILSAKSCI